MGEGSCWNVSFQYRKPPTIKKDSNIKFQLNLSFQLSYIGEIDYKNSNSPIINKFNFFLIIIPFSNMFSFFKKTILKNIF